MRTGTSFDGNGVVLIKSTNGKFRCFMRTTQYCQIDRNLMNYKFKLPLDQYSLLFDIVISFTLT